MTTTERWRLAWFATAAFVVLFGLGEFQGWVRTAWAGTGWWGIDLGLVLHAGQRLQHSESLYADPAYLYPPFAALVGALLGRLDPAIAGLALGGLKVVLVAWAILTVTPGVARAQRVLAVVIALGCLPFLHDLMLGNVNVFLVVAMVPAVLAPPRARNGILIGLLAAAFAKPLLVPVLLWLLVWRSRVFLAAVVSAAAVSLGAVLALGWEAHAAWLRALFGGTRYASPFAGNHGVSALLPELWLPVALVTAAALVLVLLRRGPVVGLVWAVTAGLLIAPYAGTYAALPIALALPSILVLSPGFALAIVAVSPLAVTHPLPIYAAAILVGSLFLREADMGSRFDWPGITIALPWRTQPAATSLGRIERAPSS